MKTLKDNKKIKLHKVNNNRSCILSFSIPRRGVQNINNYNFRTILSIIDRFSNGEDRW